MITVELIEDKTRIAEYEKEWKLLYENGTFEISTSYEWSQAIIGSLLLKHDTLLLLVFRNHSRVIGIIPLVSRRMKRYGIPITYVFPLDELFNTHSDLLINDKNQELIQLFILTLFKLKYKWDVFKIGRFVEGNPALDAVERTLNQSSYNFEVRREDPSFFITIGDNFDDYLKSRSDNFRTDVKKKSRRIKALGRVEFFDHYYFNDIAVMFEQLISIERKSWKTRHGTSIASLAMQQKFFMDMCDYALKNGWLHLQFLYLDCTPIDYNPGLLHHSKYYYLKTSFDERYAKVSPSTILRLNLIEKLIARGVNEIDFTAEPYEWQTKWTDKLRWHKSLLIFNKTLKGTLYSNYYKLKKKNETSRVRYRDPIAYAPPKQ